ncbi:hypothetical protein DDR33_21445 [Pararcticibacter amylolyticus]|uniref:Uncharacterized protein n=1 Tax=Pararcticibacter amylolyticus TaxID=2173175 RepID=A0A2U2PB62_9SPHI|nr:hypothetical protein DDR33_21445 [Pararcticibacter amylolyticus]
MVLRKNNDSIESIKTSTVFQIKNDKPKEKTAGFSCVPATCQGAIPGNSSGRGRHLLMHSRQKDAIQPVQRAA